MHRFIIPLQYVGFQLIISLPQRIFFAMTDEAQHNQDITGDGHNESVEVLSIDSISAIIKDAEFLQLNHRF